VVKQYQKEIENFVSDYLGSQWKITSTKDLSEFACHPAAVLADNDFSVFVKVTVQERDRKQFQIELDNLNYLHEKSGVNIPAPIGIINVDKTSILILEALDESERKTQDWRRIGKALAQIHKIKNNKFGFHKDGFCGPVFLDNSWSENWASFYTEQRLWPMLKMAVDSENLPKELIPRIEKFIKRLPKFCDSNIEPTLLHGDAQQNNYISTPDKAVIIDPAIYYGNREVDLASIDCFQPVPVAFFEGYQEILPIDKAFWQRKYLWRVWIYLAGISLEGQYYLKMLIDAIDKYD